MKSINLTLKSALTSLIFIPFVGVFSSEIDFARDVKPILEHNCVSCHRADNAKGDVQLDTKEATFAGDDVLVPGDPESSSLYWTTTLPIDDELITVSVGTATYCRHIGPRVWLRPALRPNFVAARHRRNKPLFLLGSAVLHQGGAEQKDAVLVNPQRRSRSVVLFLENEPLD